jgi:hypothetical protein
LRRLYNDLEGRAREANDRQLERIPRSFGLDEKGWQEYKENSRKHTGLAVLIQGKRGQQVVATSKDALAEEALPDGITRVVFDSAFAFRNYHSNNEPLDRFILTLDFSEPPVVANYDPSNAPTPNESKLEIIGPNETWVSGVYENTLAFLRHRQTRRRWLHSSQTYNIAHWLVGWPSAFWLTYRLDTWFKPAFTALPVVLRGGVYVYLVLLALLLFRSMLGALRWAYPLVELKGGRSEGARAFISTVVVGLFVALVYDVLKALI